MPPFTLVGSLYGTRLAAYERVVREKGLEFAMDVEPPAINGCLI